MKKTNTVCYHLHVESKKMKQANEWKKQILYVITYMWNLKNETS